MDKDIAAVIAALEQRLTTFGKIELDAEQSEQLLTCLRNVGKLMWEMEPIFKNILKDKGQ